MKVNVAGAGRAWCLRWGEKAKFTGSGATTRVRQPWWLWPHLLGLDATVVALAWQGWWSRASGTEQPFSQRVILGLGVWLIYLADRLADTARISSDDSATARHIFAGVWCRPLLVLLVVIGVALVALTACTLPPGQFGGGLVLLMAVGAYFWLIHRRDSQRWAARIPKETAVGGIFALGTAFFVLCRPSLPPGRVVLAIALFGFACFLNCALITSWERSLCDQRDPSSLLNAFPRFAARGLRPTCWGFAAMATAAGWTLDTTVFLPVALGALALGLLDRWKSLLSADALRSLADAALLTPWICHAVLAMIQ